MKRTLGIGFHSATDPHRRQRGNLSDLSIHRGEFLTRDVAFSARSSAVVSSLQQSMIHKRRLRNRPAIATARDLLPMLAVFRDFDSILGDERELPMLGRRFLAGAGKHDAIDLRRLGQLNRQVGARGKEPGAGLSVDGSCGP